MAQAVVSPVRRLVRVADQLGITGNQRAGLAQGLGPGFSLGLGEGPTGAARSRRRRLAHLCKRERQNDPKQGGDGATAEHHPSSSHMAATLHGVVMRLADRYRDVIVLDALDNATQARVDSGT